MNYRQQRSQGWFRDNFWIGFGLGFVMPVATFGILLFLNDELVVERGILGETMNAFQQSGGFTERLMALLGVCSNIIPFHFARRRRFDNTMRGLVIPTVVFAVSWAIYFNAFDLTPG